MELNAHAIGDRIKARRKELHLTQLDIKSKVGISSGNLSEIENGNRLPAATTLVPLSNVLKCSIDYILNDDYKERDNDIFSSLEENDQQLLNFFHAMSQEDKEELLIIAQMKYNRIKRDEKSSHSNANNIA